MALQGEVDGGIQQWVARTDKSREGLTLWGDECLVKRNTFVPWKDRFADADQAVAIAHRGWDMRDFIPTRLTLLGCAA